ncbi:CRISPR-associated protein CasA/Cse1 [Lentzea sp. NBRC 105346]|uniref:type I-E CRISPR-associated protein Cse1/CasA n=1 Tax=Lentzea sp. NBRC 105346 TaxID=3032205 RepID=UPI0024A3E4B7|nr:type I-E CRISPR-associated protein Cse1/CasA [Lentzea sp. NBRC 105346]GLZ28137.1 CRISPR-associated protein CasA/Cse1 [Lentzea sp. NBRC 105346]
MMNLLDDPWIPVTMTTGPSTEVSGQDAILRSGEIRQLAVDPPTMVPVILRQFLLPIVLDALGAPRSTQEWRRAFAGGTLFAAEETWADEQRDTLLAYFAEYHELFELFDARHPFAQVAGLRTATDDTKSTSLLVPSVASGNNVPLFSTRVGDAPLPLRPAEAARWLLHTHCWDTAAIKTGAADDPQARNGKTTGNPTGPLGQLGMVIPVGRTLAETLVLNMPIVADGLPEQDKPQWRRGPWTATWTARRAAGRRELLTWQSRRIRLHTKDTAEGLRVTSVVVCAGDRLAETPQYEPHTVWNVEQKVKAGVPPQRPRRHASGRPVWRGLDALLALGEDKAMVKTSRQLNDLAEVLELDYPLQLLTVGVEYGNQSAVVENVIADSIPLPVAALRDVAVRDAVVEIADRADKVARAVNLLSADLRRATSSEPLPWDKGQRPGERLLHIVDPASRRVLAALQRRNDPDSVEQVLTAWEQVAWQAAFDVAEPLLRDASSRQFTGLRTSHNGKDLLHCAPKAELAFRKNIRDALPRAADLVARREPNQEN